MANDPSDATGTSRLASAAETHFVLDARGRILHASDPNRSPGPRFHIVGKRAGNRFLLGHDVSETVARDIAALAREEPPLDSRDSSPLYLETYTALLASEVPVTKRDVEFDYILPRRIRRRESERIVQSGTREGDALLAQFAAKGVPPGLAEMGFKDPSEFWPPWCIAYCGGEVASVAFASRLTCERAALGVATAPAFRSRGLAASAVAAWTWHPELANRVLDYSHSRDNRSSERLTERLGLRFVGVSVSLT